MGGTSPFESKKIESRKTVDTEKVIYLDSALDYLVLEPFIIREPCPWCTRLEVLLFDGFDNKYIYYYGPETGHKPKIEIKDCFLLKIRSFSQNS